MHRLRCFFLLLVAASVLLPIPADGGDRFLTIGGGYSRVGNQVSIERNVAFVQSVVSALPGPRRRHEVLFADGADRRPDVKFRDPAATKRYPSAPYLLARVFSDSDAYGTRYRNHHLRGVLGESSPTLLESRIDALASELGKEDRLLLYATAHGGKPKSRERSKKAADTAEAEAPVRPNKYDTTLYFWRRKTMSAGEFEGVLDRLPVDMPVVLVMVQCYSGGFSHVIFNEANAELGLSPHLRCGFYSQVHDRPAAGCTEDVNEENYQEYSSFFWAALAGRSRTGQVVDTVDYDGNGRVSFAEAHAYAVLQSDTIDIPIRTTGAMLRAIRKGNDSSIRPSGSMSNLWRTARPDQWAILVGMPGKIGLDTRATVDQVRTARRRLRRELSSANRELSSAARRSVSAKSEVRRRLRETWKEIGNGRNRFAKELVTARADEFIEQVESLPEYEAFLCAEDRREQLERKVRDAKNREIKALRLLRTCENIALADELLETASAEIIERYEQIRALEEGYLVE